MEVAVKRSIKVLSYGKKYHVCFMYHDHHGNTEDGDFVRVIVQRIESHGFICYYKGRDLLPGQQKIKAMLQSLRQSIKIVIVLSKAYMQCAFCQNELSYAVHENMSRSDIDNPEALIPLRLDRSNIPIELGPIECLEVSSRDYFDWINVLLISIEAEAKCVQNFENTTNSNETRELISSSDNLVSTALSFSCELKKANRQALYSFLTKPIACELSDFLYQSDVLRGFHLAMDTVGIAVKNDTVSITMDVFKEYAPRPYHIGDIFEEHVGKEQFKNIDKVSLIVSGNPSLLSRQFENDIHQFNQIVRNVLKAKSDHYLTGIMYDVKGIPYDRDIRDKCRFLVHDAVVEKIDEDIVSHPQFSSYEARIETYRKWPSDKRPAKESLAEAGYFLDEKGVVHRCFYCNGVDWDFKPHEDPWKRHAKWYYNCPFVRCNKDINFITESRFGKSTPRQYYNIIYKDFKERLLTFQTWPHENCPHAFFMADAGLYFTRLEDKVCCFDCGHGFRNWRMKDDPWFRHALMSPKCNFVRRNKSKRYLTEVRNERKKICPTDHCSITYRIKSREAR